jgi:hypothetical protein
MMGSTAWEGVHLGLDVIGVVPEFMRATAGETPGINTEWVQTMGERKVRFSQLVN